jgi:hypothetical protein
MTDRFSTNRLGQIAVAKVELRALELGYFIFKPTMECRYDLVLDDGIKLYRTQVKYAGAKPSKHVAGAITLSLRKWRQNGRKALLSYSRSEIDLLLVYLAVIDRILWFGPDQFDEKSYLQLRYAPSKNNQVKNCLMAQDYVW